MTKSYDNEGNINEDQDSVKPFHQFPNSVKLDNSRISVINDTQNGHNISKNSLNLSKLMNSDLDPNSEMDEQEPAIQTMNRSSNPSPVKMSIDLTKILAKRE